MREIAQLVNRSVESTRLCERLRKTRSVKCTGVPEGTVAALAGVVSQLLRSVAVILCDSSEAASRMGQDFESLHPGINRLVLDPGSPFLRSSLSALTPPAVIIASGSALTTPAPAADMPTSRLTLAIGDRTCLADIVEWIERNNYERTDLVTEPGEYAARGGIVDIFPMDADAPVRIELAPVAAGSTPAGVKADESVYSLRKFDPLTQRSTVSIDAVSVPSLRPAVPSAELICKLLPRDGIFIVHEHDPDVRPTHSEIGTAAVLTITESPDADCDLGFRSTGSYLGNIEPLRAEIAHSSDRYYIVARTPNQCERLKTLLGHRPRYLIGVLSRGFCHLGFNTVVLTEREICGIATERPVQRRFKGLPVDNLLALQPGDYVVHIDYGVGLFEGTSRLTHSGVERDFLVIRYADNDRVYIPVENLTLIDRYVGESAPSALDRLGGRSWRLARSQAARASAEYARELLKMQAQRQLARGTSFPPDTPEQSLLEAAFPHQETPDQLTAINEVKRDMQSSRPMDRLICGDVGFGKTEIALRAAFKAAMSFKQVALLCPTTVLAYQHYVTFRQRLAQFPLCVGMLSRLASSDATHQILAGLADGRVDIVVGTHALLSSRVRFHDLGLVIIDEEQRFGVRQKERIRALKAGLDVLTLTATPIPRTLYMALTGIRDISTIHTPPPGRREIATEVAEWNDLLIRDYVARELTRHGQVFFVHNEIQTIREVHKRLCRILPDAKILVAHGRLSARQLTNIYMAFAEGKYDLLLSTAIVESGIDMPNVNTIIVNRADRFGLADLHQLRGRVGRSSKQAYALFLVSRRTELTAEARKRLSALLAYSRLGSGYRLALRDMEIRGIGNLLGTEQHGHIARVGLTLYSRMLKDAVNELNGLPVSIEPELSLELPAYIPEGYVKDSFERVALYKRLLATETESELAEIRAELVDRFGRYPPVVEQLFKIALVRIRARRAGLLRVELKKETATLVGPERTEVLKGGIDALLAHLAV